MGCVAIRACGVLTRCVRMTRGCVADGAVGAEAEEPVASCGVAMGSLRVGGLPAGTSVVARVRLQNARGWSDWSARSACVLLPEAQ